MKWFLLVLLLLTAAAGFYWRIECFNVNAEHLFSESLQHETHGAYYAAALGYKVILEKYPGSFRAEDASLRLNKIRRFTADAENILKQTRPLPLAAACKTN